MQLLEVYFLKVDECIDQIETQLQAVLLSE